MRYRMFVAVAVGLCLTAGAATAGPVFGKDLRVQIFYDGVELDPATYTLVFTVTNGVELPSYGGGGNLAVDVFDAGADSFSILFTTNIPVTYGSAGNGQNAVVITPVSVDIPAFTAASIGTASPVFDDPTRVSFTPGNVAYNFDSLTAVAGDFVRVDVTVAPAAVPEPASAVLAGAGGLAVAAWRRRRPARA